MENKWIQTCKALKELLQILTCSKCEKRLYDQEQFLMCGHFTCTSCLNKNNTICTECKDRSKNGSVIKDALIKNIANACNIIAQEIGFKQNDGNIEINIEEAQMINKTNEIDNTKVNNSSNLLSIKSKINLNQGICTKNARKRKKLDWTRNKNFKLLKYNKATSTFNIPKNINKRNYHGETRLQEECRKGNEDNVKKLLAAGADPNVCCNANWTPLQESADYGYYEITKMLLNAGALVNQPGYEGRTALHEAAKRSNLKLVTLLVQYKVDKDIIDNKGNKPIDYCQLSEIKKLLGYSNKNEVQYNIVEANKNEIIHKNISNINYSINSEETRFNVNHQNNSEENFNFNNNLSKPNNFHVNGKNIKAKEEFNYYNSSLNKTLYKNSNYLNEIDNELHTAETIPDNIRRNIINVNDNNVEDKTDFIKRKMYSNEISCSQETIDVEKNCNSENIIFISEKFEDVTSLTDYKSNIFKTLVNADDCINIDSQENAEDCIFIDSEEFIDVIN